MRGENSFHWHFYEFFFFMTFFHFKFLWKKTKLLTCFTIFLNFHNHFLKHKIGAQFSLVETFPFFWIICMYYINVIKAYVRYFSLFLKEKCISSLFQMEYIEKKFNLQLCFLPIVSRTFTLAWATTRCPPSWNFLFWKKINV